MSEETLALAIAPTIPVGEPSLTPRGEELILDTLSTAGMVGRVSTPEENEASVKSELAIKALLKQMEDLRVELTRPALEHQRKLKAFFDQKGAELRAELQRLTRLSGDWIQLQEKKRQAEENARREELTRLEREREAAIAAATSHEEVEAVQAHFNDRAAVEAVPPPPIATVAKGQSAKPDWEWEIIDVHMFARCYPSCVKIEDKASEIKALLRAGAKMTEAQGIRVRQITKVGTRLPQSKAPIDV